MYVFKKELLCTILLSIKKIKNNVVTFVLFLNDKRLNCERIINLICKLKQHTVTTNMTNSNMTIEYTRVALGYPLPPVWPELPD